MKLPTKIKVVDTEYKIKYFDRMPEVDPDGIESLYGRIDYHNRAIRVYRGNRSKSDIYQTIWHEILHGICERLKLVDVNNN